MNHSPTPWYLLAQENGSHGVDSSAGMVALFHNIDDARQTIAAVHACKGIPLKVLESLKEGIVREQFALVDETLRILTTNQQTGELLDPEILKNFAISGNPLGQLAWKIYQAIKGSTLELIRQESVPATATKKLVLPIADSNEFYDKTADHAVIELSHKAIAHIKQLAEAVKSLRVYKITEFYNICDFTVTDWEADPDNGKIPMKEFEGATELVTLNVTDDGFYWTGLYKHTDVRWSTETVPLTALDEADDYDLRKEAE